jgi:hypothetical protein
MSNIQFDCEVTEYAILPNKDNSENCFVLSDKCMIINFMSTKGLGEEVILMQSEIERKDALELAKLIILKYS